MLGNQVKQSGNTAQEQAAEISRELFPEARHMNDFAHLCQGQYLCLRTHPHTFHYISSNLRQTGHCKVCPKNTHIYFIHQTRFIEHLFFILFNDSNLTLGRQRLFIDESFRKKKSC